MTGEEQIAYLAGQVRNSTPTAFEGPRRLYIAGICGNNDDSCARKLFTNRCRGVDAVLLGHLQIHQHNGSPTASG